MHHDIAYTGEEETKRVEALADLAEWLGQEKFNMLADFLRASEAIETNRQSFRMQMMVLAGVQGYPVDAMLDSFLGKE